MSYSKPFNKPMVILIYVVTVTVLWFLFAFGAHAMQLVVRWLLRLLGLA